jgi:hypothetical protein
MNFALQADGSCVPEQLLGASPAAAATSRPSWPGAAGALGLQHKVSCTLLQTHAAFMNIRASTSTAMERFWIRSRPSGTIAVQARNTSRDGRSVPHRSKVRFGSRTAVAGRLVAQPVYPRFGNTPCAPALTLRAQCTKSLRSSPLRGGKSREAGSRWRGQR